MSIYIQHFELDEFMLQVQSRLSTDQQAVIDAMDININARSKTIITYIYLAEIFYKPRTT